MARRTLTAQLCQISDKVTPIDQKATPTSGALQPNFQTTSNKRPQHPQHAGRGPEHAHQWGSVIVIDTKCALSALSVQGVARSMPTNGAL